MGTKEFIVFALSLGIVVVSQVSNAQHYGRMRGLSSMHKDQCCCSYDDLTYLIALARALDEKETSPPLLPTPPSPPPPPPPPSPTQPTTSGSYLSNFEDLIMKLVNALVYTTTETTKNTCRCTHSIPTTSTSPGTVSVPPNNGNNGGYGSGAEMTGSSNSYYHHLDGGLVNLDVLNSNKPGNLLDLDLADRHIAGVALGGRSNDGGASSGQYPPVQYPSNQQPVNQYPTNQYPTNEQPPYQPPTNQQPSNQNPTNHYPTTQQPTGPYTPNQQPTGQSQTGQVPSNQPPNGKQSTGGKPNNNPNTDGGLLNVDLLDPNKRNNVADVDVGNLNLGVGIGGGGSPAPINNNGHDNGYDKGYKNNAPNSGEGLLNVDVANPNKKNNVADVDLVGQDLLGVGIGS